MTTERKDMFAFKIKGKLFYAHIKEPNNKGKYPSGKYETDISIDNKNAEALNNLRITVKNKNDDRGNHIKVRSIFQPRVFTEQGVELSKESFPLIGNGSEAIITVQPYVGKKGDICLGFSAIELIKLLEYKVIAPKLLVE